MGYLIEPNETEIVKAKVIITEAELLAGNIVKSIPEYPGVRFKAWQVLYFNLLFNGTPYTGANSIHIEAQGTSRWQARPASGFLSVSPFWIISPIAAQSGASTFIQFANNSELQIHSPLPFTGGTGDLTCYIGATLFTT